MPSIIIKPRMIAAANSPTAEQSDEEGEIHSGEEENENDNTTPGMDVDEPEENASENPALDSLVTRHRGPGRPRGRGRGAAPGISTPRGRGRGRGRARGRGRGGSVVIRLPKRDDDDENPSDQPDDDPSSQIEQQVEEPPPTDGRPFRKIGGKIYLIENDELTTENDEKGDTKIDKNGVLLGGRTFKASTFVLPTRHPQRVYMLAIDAARTSGFRDSLYYFRRNPLAHKLNVTQPEKDLLIEQGKLGSHLKTRSVTLITVRSAFKLHGSKMVVDGRWVTDDYYEDKALEEAASRGAAAGDLVGSLPDPNFYSNEATALALANKSANAAGNIPTNGGTMGIYRPGGPTTVFGGSGWGPYSDGPINAARKGFLNRENVGEETWMFEAAKRTSEATAEWARLRKEARIPLGGLEHEKTKNATTVEVQADEENEEEEEEVIPDQIDSTKRPGEPAVPGTSKRRKVREDDLPLGVYEPHSDHVFYRVDSQPTQSRWEALPDSGEKRQVLGGTKTGNGAWALAWIDTVLEVHQDDDTQKLREEEVLLATQSQSI